ncbi:protein kinase [bacterium]|nr:protein kinase [candidate division CSSED10-310 bacterium]
MAIVYKGRHTQTGDLVAVKTLTRISRIHAAGLRREIQILTHIKHPGIVRVFDVGDMGGIPWIAMELLRGDTLRQTMAQIESLESFLHIIRQICRSLAYLHSNGIVHMDVKPDNIFLTDQGFPVLMDFGVIHRFAGKKGRETLDSGQFEFGTWEYMAPEILHGDLPDARADLYSIGCILYEFITGRVPFQGDSIDELLTLQATQVLELPNFTDKPLSAKLTALIIRLLALNPFDQPGYADLVAHQLADLGDTLRIDRDSSAFVSRPHLYRSRFIGREDEITLFDSKLALLRAGYGGCLFIAGEGGIGKTRTLMEMGRFAKKAGFAVLLGECQESMLSLQRDRTEVPALQGFQRPVETLVDNIREHKVDDRIDCVGEHARILADYFESLTHVLTVMKWPEPVLLSHDAGCERLFFALKTFFFESARIFPLIIMIDDLHRADELTIDFISYLLRTESLSRVQIFLIAAFRLEETTEKLRHLLRQPDVSVLRLAPFEQGQVDEMISNMLAIKTASSEFFDLLFEKSEGNPFFLSEILKTAVDEGILQLHQGTGWRLVQEPGNALKLSSRLSLPGSLHDVLKLRLSGIEEPASSVLDVLAVLGREVSPSLLARVIQIEESEWRIGLQELIFQMVIDETSRGTFRFVHEEFRWTAYRRLPAQKRNAIHKRAAEELERLPGHNRMMWFAEMALHLEKSHQMAKSKQYYLSAGRQAVQRYALDLATRLYLKYLESESENDSEQLHVRIEFAQDILMINGRLDQALKILRPVIIASKKKGFNHIYADSLRSAANIYWQRGEYSRGWVLAQEALDIYKHLKAESTVMALLQDMANAASESGDFLRAQVYFDRCRSNLGKLGNADKQGRLLADLGALVVRMGQSQKGISLLLEAEETVKKNGGDDGDRLVLAQINLQLGIAATRTGSVDMAGERLEQAIRLYQSVGYRRGEAAGLSQLAELFLCEGAYDDASEFSREAWIIYKDTGNRSGCANADYQFARILIKKKRFQEALRTLEKCRFQFSELDDEFSIGLLFVAMGQALFESDCPIDVVMRHFEDAEAIFRKRGNVIELIHCLCLEGLYGFHSGLSQGKTWISEIYDEIIRLLKKNNLTPDCLLDQEIDKLRLLLLA